MKDRPQLGPNWSSLLTRLFILVFYVVLIYWGVDQKLGFAVLLICMGLVVWVFVGYALFAWPIAVAYGHGRLETFSIIGVKRIIPLNELTGFARHRIVLLPTQQYDGVVVYYSQGRHMEFSSLNIRYCALLEQHLNHSGVPFLGVEPRGFAFYKSRYAFDK